MPAVKTRNWSFEPVIGLGFKKQKLQRPQHSYDGVLWTLTLPFCQYSFGFLVLPEPKFTNSQKRKIVNLENKAILMQGMKNLKPKK
jgi:hypothetical protein